MASSRLSELPEGRFACDMKRSLPDGRARLVLTAFELLEKLEKLVLLILGRVSHPLSPVESAVHVDVVGRWSNSP